MKITISEAAQKWYEEEIGIPEGYGIRFLGKVYGSSPVHEGFSLGITVDKPDAVMALTTINNIPYFVDANDEWFFSGYDLEVILDETLNEPEYLFHKNN